jgi:hypothetical protein
LIPLYLKQKNKYELYVADLRDYLCDFFQRVQPLINFKEEVLDQVQEMFDSEWEQRSLFGWEGAIARINGDSAHVEDEGNDDETASQFHCVACNKTFMNESVFHHHKKGKRHIKAVNQLSKQTNAPSIEQSNFNAEVTVKKG